MKPEPVPDEHIWKGAERIRFDPPEGHDPDNGLMEIMPVEGLVDEIRFEHGDKKMSADRIHFRISVDDMDLEQLRKRGWFWLVFYGGVYPFDVAHPEIDDVMDTGGDDDGNSSGGEAPGPGPV